MTILEISECFPNNFKPVTGEFILQHVSSLSVHCRVIMFVPLRFVPSKELISINPVRFISNIKNWHSKLKATKDLSADNLKIIYFRYFSLPRPLFESIENKVIKFFFYERLKKAADELKPSIIYCNWLRPWSEISCKLASELDIPFVIDHHEDIPTLKKLFPKDYVKFLKVFEKADGIIVHSTLNKFELEKENLNLAEIKIIYLGQNFSVNDREKDFNFRKVKLVCVSHLNERRKNIEILIVAALHLKGKLDYELQIIGDGILKEYYVNLAHSLNLNDDIIFTGMKSQSEIESMLEESHIFVLPSYPEAFGVVFIEALAKGVPVITCEGNGGGEELKNLGYPTELIRPNSPEELSLAILELSSDKDKLSKMSKTGKQIAEKYFSWEKNASNTYNYLQEIISSYESKKI